MAVNLRSEAQVMESVLLAAEAALLVVRNDPALTVERRERLEGELRRIVGRLVSEGLRVPATQSLF